MKDLISIIVPVYNASNYLNRCIVSLINQTYKNIEILLIDDGSTDNSYLICDSFSKTNKRIFVYHKKNEGVAKTRNFGIRKATGNYITFVDSDDYVSPYYVARLYNYAQNFSADISICNHYEFSKQGFKLKAENKIDVIEFSGIEAIKNMLYQNEIDCSFWGKLYKKELFQGIEIKNYRVFEDMDTLYKLFLKSNKVVYINEMLYFYFCRKDSLIHSNFSKDNLVIIDILSNMKNELKNLGLENAVLIRTFNAYFYILRNSRINSYNYNTAKKFIKKYRHEVLKSKNINFKDKMAIYLSYIGFWTIKPCFYFYTLLK